MRRREFIGFVGSAAATWPFAAQAQSPAVPSIGYLHAGALGPSVEQLQSFLQGLRQFGYIDRENVMLEYRWAEGRYERLPALAVELVQLPVAVLLTGGGPAVALAAKAATTTTPIVFVSGDDPVRYDLVATLNRPGGNITGAVFFNPALVAKRLALLHDLLPGATLGGYLVNTNNPESEFETQEAEHAAAALGLKLHVVPASNSDEIDAAFAKLGEIGVQMVIVASDPFLFSRREQVATLARRDAVPLVGTTHEYVDAGALASYGNSIPEAFRQAGVYVGRILKGESPSDLPVVQSSKFELVINLKTANNLKLTIPPAILALADRAIE